MGYRHYLYIVPRKTVEDIKDMSVSDLEEHMNYDSCLLDEEVSVFEIVKDVIMKNIFFEFGKYYENAKNIYKLGKPLFSNADTQNRFCEYVPYVVERDAVLCAIEDYRQKVIDWYKGLLQSQEEYDASHKPWERSHLKQEQRIHHHLKNKLDEWENSCGLLPYDTNEESEQIVRSWLYEYEVFELVHRLKTMDWENNTLVFCGW